MPAPVLELNVAELLFKSICLSEIDGPKLSELMNVYPFGMLN